MPLKPIVLGAGVVTKPPEMEELVPTMEDGRQRKKSLSPPPGPNPDLCVVIITPAGGNNPKKVNN